MLVLRKLLQRFFSIVFLFFDWLKSNHLRSLIERGFFGHFSCHICSAVTETTRVTNYAISFGAPRNQQFGKQTFSPTQWFPRSCFSLVIIKYINIAWSWTIRLFKYSLPFSLFLRQSLTSRKVNSLTADESLLSGCNNRLSANRWLRKKLRTRCALTFM